MTDHRHTVSLSLCALLAGACAPTAEHVAGVEAVSAESAERADVRTLVATPTSNDPGVASAGTSLRAVAFRLPLGAAATSGLTQAQLDALDSAFLTRIDLHAVGGRARVWMSDGDVVAARLRMEGHSTIVAGLLGGRQGTAWFDDRGFALAGPLRARPLSSSVITSPFGARLHPVTGRAARHEGTDYGAPEGTAVFAVGDGRVRRIGTSAKAGRFLVLEHAHGYESRYLHLRAVAASLAVGDRVRQGDVVGTVGKTGRVTGPHLHFELRLAGIAVDPLATLPLPSTALGTRALHAHRAFLAALP